MKIGKKQAYKSSKELAKTAIKYSSKRLNDFNLIFLEFHLVIPSVYDYYWIKSAFALHLL